MYPHSRESKGNFHSGKIATKITAEFLIPSNKDSSTEDLQLTPHKVQHYTYPASSHNSRICQPQRNGNPTPKPFILRLDPIDNTWKFEISYKRLQNISLKHNHMSGSIYLRCKYFGNWEPMEFQKHFGSEKLYAAKTSDQSFIQPLFAAEFLEPHIPDYTIEMTLKLEHFTLLEEEEMLLSRQRAEMNNALIQNPQKTDYRIKVESGDFFVHQRLIAAFSTVCKISSKYQEDNFCDWSDIMTKDSIQGLLRYIYYSETDAIDSPEVAYSLLKFSHMYQESNLFRICEKKLMSFSDEEYKLPGILDMYVDVRIPDEFKELKQFFCRVLYRNIKKYNPTELTTLAQGYPNGLGVTSLVEISQVEEEKDGGSARSEATIRLTVEGISQLREEVLSKATMVRNLPWRIMVKPRQSQQQQQQTGGPNNALRNMSLGFFLQCNGDGNSSSWNCSAVATLRIVPQKNLPTAEPFSRKISHIFHSKESDWGYSYFLDWTALMDPSKGFIKNDAILLEVDVKADIPYGVAKGL